MQKIITLILFFALQFASAQSASEYNSGAINAYNAGNYAQAKEYFELALSSTDNATTNYNLANTCEKLGEIGSAKAYYMRAIYQNPRFKEAIFNLNALDKKYALSSLSTSKSDAFYSTLSRDEWGLLGGIFFWLAVILFIVLPLLKIKKPWQFFLGTIFFVIFAVTLSAVLYWNTYANTCIALIDNAPLKLSPTKNSEIASTTKQGQMFSIKKHRNNFILIQDANKKGWIEQNDKNFLGVATSKE